MESASFKKPVKSTGFEQHRRSAKSSNMRFMMAGAVIVIAAVTLAFVAMQGSAVYYVTVKQFAEQQTTLAADKEIRVAGKVVPGTIVRDSAGVTSFTAMDKEDPATRITVSYAKLPPDTFKDEAEVVVTGHYKNGVFAANEMLAKCPSKYSSTPDA
jgi:cytochrome c-type biogenesis protein CcmE